MENKSHGGSSGGPRHRSIQILDISNHLHTLIRVGYAAPPNAASTPPSSPSAPKSLAKRSGFRRTVSGSRRQAIMNSEETIWRRWRSKIHWSNAKHSRRFSDDDKIAGDLTRYRQGLAYGDFQAATLGSSIRNRHVKDLSSNLNMVNYNNSYNGIMMTQHTSSMQHKSNNNHKKFDDDLYHAKVNLHGTFTDYCYHCTIHGLKYVGDSSLPNFERIFWILSFLLAICGAGYFIWLLYSKFSLSPIIISRSPETVSIDLFPFPAVTVCNMNNAKKSVAEEIVRGNDSVQKLFLEDICDTKNNLTFSSNETGEWDNVYAFLLNVSQPCTNMLHYCEWRESSRNCSDLFNPVLTDEGLCCNFNNVPRVLYDPRVWKDLDISYASETRVDWNPEYKYTEKDPPTAIPWRAFGSGSNKGLTLAIDVDADEYYCSSTASVGFKMLLHSPVEMPQIADFAFTLSPGKETRVIITPHITDADPSIKKILPKIRRCYFLSERKLRYYRTYTQRNCVLECEANFTLKYCKCMQYYMPVTNDTRICAKKDDDCALKARNIMKDKLYEEDDNAFNITEVPSCKCYPGCNEINYSTEISQSMLMTTFEIPAQFFKYNESYFEKNIAIVHIFFIDSSYVKYVKNELYGFPELLSNTGGLLGLFMGFSLLSVTEIFYYFTIRLWWRMWKYKTKKNNQNRFVVQKFTKRHDAVYPFSQ